MRLDHVNIATTDLDGAKDFFVRILGLDVGERPPFPFPGFWLYAGDQPIVHLVGRASKPDSDSGSIDHVAFRGDDLDQLVKRLRDAGVEHRIAVVPETGRRQVFFRGPDDVKIEVGFPPA